MKKNPKAHMHLRHLNSLAAFWVLIFLVLSQCTQKSSESSNTTEGIRTPDTTEGIRTLIVGGGESHDFDKWFQEVDSRTLRENGLATVKYTDSPDSIAHYLQNMDVLYLTNNQPIHDPQSRQAIIDFADAGKGLVLGHAALWYNWSDWPEYNQQLVSGGSRGHDKYGSFHVNITNENHPVTEGVVKEFTIKDELYYFKVDENGPGIEMLATASTESSEVFPSVFIVKHPNTRIVGLALGHDGESHNLEAYETILRNAVKWVANK